MIQSAVFASTSMVFGEMALLDYGRGAEWPRLTVKLRAYRDYVERMLDSQLCDFVLFLDAYDAVVTGTEREIMDRVLALEARTGKPILFGAETAPDKYQEAFEDLAKAQNVSTPWRYLNSGLMVGRVWALRIFLREMLHDRPKEDPTPDQVLCANFSLFRRPDLVGLDYDTELFLNAFGIEGILDGAWAWERGQPRGSVALVESGGKRWIENKVTRRRPVVFHFLGSAKFSKRAPCLKNPWFICYRSLPFEVVRLLLPEAYAGWRLDTMQDLFDDLSTPWLPRWNGDDYLHFQRTWSLLQKMKLRERIISYLVLLDVAFLAAFAWHRFRQRGQDPMAWCNWCLPRFRLRHLKTDTCDV
ncbi:unnamed protein product [Symbiodinium natans]|uniref:PLOD1-3-like GT domain-containing protein n=1 Tax=Symbiodinium natans TaxID=878477 RepID=A0A812JAI2_9DINO|nr:unnamed protein product [Symbiodinium natans]